MIARLAVLSLALSLGLAVACGGSSDDDLFGGKSGSGGGYSGAAGGGDGGTTSGGSSGDGGASASGGASGAGGVGVGGAGGAGGATGGAGGELGGAGGSLGGAGGSPGGTGGTGGTLAKTSVECNDKSCDVPGNYCCQNFDFGSYTWNGTCQANGSFCDGGNIACDGPEDCNSFDDCCGQISQFAGNDYYSSFKCVPKGSCSQSNQRLICGNTPGICPTNTTCTGSSLLPGYNVCSQ